MDKIKSILYVFLTSTFRSIDLTIFPALLGRKTRDRPEKDLTSAPVGRVQIQPAIHWAKIQKVGAIAHPSLLEIQTHPVTILPEGQKPWAPRTRAIMSIPQQLLRP